MVAALVSEPGERYTLRQELGQLRGRASRNRLRRIVALGVAGGVIFVG